MEKWLKYSRSIAICLVVTTIFSCDTVVEPAIVTKDYSDLVLEREENAYYEAGIERGYAQGSEKQLQFLDSVTIKYPNYSNGWYERGVWELKTGNIIQYFQYMDKATEMDPEEHLGWRANIKMRFTRDYEGALKDYYDLLELMNAEDYPARAESSRYSMGQIYYQLGEYEKAIENLDISIRLVADDIGEEWVDVYTFYFRGICYYELGKYEEAILDLNKSIKYYEECSEAYYYRALAEYNLNRLEAAKESIAQAKHQFKRGYFRDESYIEVFAPVFMKDILTLEEKINS